MTTRATRDKWIKAAQATAEHERARKAKALETAAECQRRIDEAGKRVDWLKAMPVDDPVQDDLEPEDRAEENPATDVAATDVDEILDVRAAADAMPDDDEGEPFEYAKGEGEVPVRPGLRAPADDNEPTTWANDDARASV